MLHCSPNTHIPPASTHETPKATISRLNKTLRHHGATDVLRAAFTAIPRLALVSSFGAESAVLLHLTAMISRDTPVLFIDTELLFPETLIYQQELAAHLRLRNLTIIRAGNLASADSTDTLHRTDKTACCALRKTRPLQDALAGFDGWITGRKHYQSQGRARLDFFETEAATGRIKVNPLIRWRPQDIQDYLEQNRLPRHPLVAAGYPSIGCAPCTTKAAPGEDPRAGRWRGTEKDECGIHFENGKLIRTGAPT